MDVRNCKTCGKMFNYLSGPPICPGCEKELEKKYEEVKDYIYDNPGISIGQVSEDLDVSSAQIKKWVREERLSFSDDSSVGIDCEKCGVSIKTGRFCPRCKESMVQRLDSVYQKPKPVVTEVRKKDSTKDKMRFLDGK